MRLYDQQAWSAVFLFVIVPIMTAWPAPDRYVSLAGTNGGGFTNWAGAATNIKDAVDLANANNDGDTVWVADGIYNVPITIIVSNTIVRGFSGNPWDVVVNGGGVTQCFILRHPGATLDALTMSNGYNVVGALLRGGAVTIETGKASNVVIGWSYAVNGGGVMIRGNVPEDALLERSLIISNWATTYGGGVEFYSGCGILRDSTIVSNFVASSGGHGGGIGTYMMTDANIHGCLVQANTCNGNGGGIYYSGTVTGRIWNCTVENNVASGGASYGAGIYFASPGDIRNSIIRNNSSSNYAGGMAISRSAGAGNVRSCLLVGNLSKVAGGGLYGRYPFTMENCTIVANSTGRGGGFYVFDTNAVFRNCIIYDNFRTNTTYDSVDIDGTFNTNQCIHCCSTRSLPTDQGNITNAPLWVDEVGGDYRLQPQSLCINTGANMNWMAEVFDLDGFQRIDRFSGKVDMGCYEYVPEGMLFIGR